MASAKPHAFGICCGEAGREIGCSKAQRKALFVKLSRISFLVLAALLAGCATQKPDVATYYHPNDGLRMDVITDNPLDTEGPAREALWLNASRVFKTATKYDFYLEVTYAAKLETGYLDIGPGQTLTIVADDRELKFNGIGSRNLRRSRGGLVNENALYLAQADEIRAIAAAAKVTVRVTGQNGVVQREFKPANTDRFKKFVEKYVSAAKP